MILVVVIVAEVLAKQLKRFNSLKIQLKMNQPSTASLGNTSEAESAYDTGDEDLWDAAVRTRNRSMRRPSRERRRGSIGKQSHCEKGFGCSVVFMGCGL